MSDAKSSTFTAVRRARGVVIIRGTVPRPGPDMEAYLSRVPEARTDTRSFTLKWRREHQRTPDWGSASVDYVAREVPDFVRTLKIVMPDGSEYRIRSQRPPDR